MQDHYWKHTIDDLRSQAAAVIAAPAADGGSVSARQAAAILAGICGFVARRSSVDAMQQACATLARMKVMDFGKLPTGFDGRVAEEISLIASVARSVRSLAGDDAVRAALAFWASEDDPAIWNQVAA